MKKIYAISDIHGCYDEMISALDKAGFDINNENHLLVTAGDMFDRGTKSLAIFEYLYPLCESGRAICVRGNHDSMFLDYLTGVSVSPFNYLRNGSNETFADFLGRTMPFESWCMLEEHIEEPTRDDFIKWVSGAVKEINTNYPHLVPWLRSMPYYYETKNYIITHASIDTNATDWHNPIVPWSDLIWDNGSFFGKQILNTGKNIIMGHFGTRHLREMYNIDLDNEDIYSPLLSKNGRILAIDATTNLSHKVNVVVFEDELL